MDMIIIKISSAEIHIWWDRFQNIISIHHVSNQPKPVKDLFYPHKTRTRIVFTNFFPQMTPFCSLVFYFYCFNISEFFYEVVNEGAYVLGFLLAVAGKDMPVLLHEVIGSFY